MPNSLLHEAVAKANFVDVHKLINQGVNVNEKNSFGYTPLHYGITCATHSNGKAVIELLLKANADVNLKTEEGFTVLQLALNRYCLDHDVAKMLFEAGADVNSRNTVRGETALHVAVNNKDKKMIEYLLSLGCDVNIENNVGVTAVQYALNRRSLDLVMMLINLEDESNIDCRSENGVTTLHAAASSDNVTMVEYLIYRGISVHAKDDRARTPLHYACSDSALVTYDMKKTIKCLLKHGADLNALDKHGQTPLMLVLNKSSFRFNNKKEKELLEFFLQNSGIVNIMNSEGKNILNICETKELREMIFQHIAKLQALNLMVDMSLLETVTKSEDDKQFLLKCLDELELASRTKIQNSWVTYFNLLVDSARKLKNYAGNRDLVKNFQKCETYKGYSYTATVMVEVTVKRIIIKKFYISDDCKKMFPIYGDSILKNMVKGIKRRKLFDESAVELSYCMPIFNPSHLIIRDILDFISTGDLSKFCKMDIKHA